MKLGVVNGRSVVVVADGVVDVDSASQGRFSSDPMALYDVWDQFVEWAAEPGAATGPLPDVWDSPVPRPRQVFAIGLNYRSHAEESGMGIPEVPATFTKFPASLSNPFDDIPIANPSVDWEVEVVAVIGRRADSVDESEGWSHIAGVTIGQDISDRTLQFAAGAQFSLGKSRVGYGPIGPYLVTPDELENRDDLPLGCSINGETVQESSTGDLIFSVPKLVAELSAVVPLLPGDVIFTGTPDGVGIARQPPRFLQDGDVLESWVGGVGRIRNRCVTA